MNLSNKMVDSTGTRAVTLQTNQFGMGRYVKDCV